jgi:hypothetical protein
VSTWQPGYRAFISTDATWMAEDVELAPDWVRDEMNDSAQDLREWMSSQGWVPAVPGEGAARRPGRRGRKPRR